MTEEDNTADSGPSYDEIQSRIAALLDSDEAYPPEAKQNECRYRWFEIDDLQNSDARFDTLIGYCPVLSNSALHISWLDS